MAIATKCQTSGAQFHTNIRPEKISVEVDFGKKITLNKKEAELLEANIHNVIEIVLSKYY